jgi:hypothetical protein
MENYDKVPLWLAESICASLKAESENDKIALVDCLEELNSDINVAENNQEISSVLAWELRDEYL